MDMPASFRLLTTASTELLTCSSVLAPVQTILPLWNMSAVVFVLFCRRISPGNDCGSYSASLRLSARLLRSISVPRFADVTMFWMRLFEILIPRR